MEWPKPDDRLFISAGDWQNNACIFKSGGSLSSYADNYMAGAKALVKAVGDGNAILDCVIYPIVFLYRHYLELSIKEIILLCRQLKNDQAVFPQHHNLGTLWDEAKQLLVEHYGVDAPPEVQNLDAAITDFAVHDPNSFAFRYPWDKKGNCTLQNLNHINLRNLHEAMERISAFLDCMCIDLGERLQWCCDRDREYDG